MTECEHTELLCVRWEKRERQSNTDSNASLSLSLGVHCERATCKSHGLCTHDQNPQPTCAVAAPIECQLQVDCERARKNVIGLFVSALNCIEKWIQNWIAAHTHSARLGRTSSYCDFIPLNRYSWLRVVRGSRSTDQSPSVWCKIAAYNRAIAGNDSPIQELQDSRRQSSIRYHVPQWWSCKQMNRIQLTQPTTTSAIFSLIADNLTSDS